MKLILAVTQGAAKGRRIPISLPQFVIGRDNRCHLRPVSQAVSKRHCELLVRGEQAFVKDLDSATGTFVNGERIQGEREEVSHRAKACHERSPPATMARPSPGLGGGSRLE